jgi:membrane associated rhomboid family serine protease
VIPLHDDNPTQLTPIVTMIFIAACVAVFLYQAGLPQEPADVFVFLSSSSKCNTASPDGLRCCHAHEIVPTLDCGRT